MVQRGRRVSGTDGSKGVKFEDGLLPGQGKEGETVIISKPNRNVVERTVMTFVMIAGFIRQCTLLLLSRPTNSQSSSVRATPS